MNMTTGRRGIVWKTPDITADGLKMFACITNVKASVHPQWSPEPEPSLNTVYMATQKLLPAPHRDKP